MKKCIAAMLAACLLAAPAGAVDEPSGWAREAVQTAREAGLVPEELDGAYAQPVTRAEFCALAAAVYHAWEEQSLLGEIEKNTVLFTDCTDGDVLLCASVGIVNGVGSGRFEPDQPVQRQEAAAMLHRLGMLRADYDGSVQGRLPHVFADGADISSWARTGVNWAYRHGIMTGTGDNAFDPLGKYTREQSIATMLRIYDAQYAVIPPAEQAEEPYRVVTDAQGVGVSQMHLEDADGNRLLTDFRDTNGQFYSIQLFGDWAALQPTAGGDALLYQLKTGEVLDGYRLDEAALIQSDIAWARSTKDYRQGIVVYADGTWRAQSGTPLTEWYRDRAIVDDGGSVRAIDRDGNTLWSMNISLDQVELYSGIGDRMVIERDGMYCPVIDGKMGTVSASPMRLNRWSDTCIVQENGYHYALYDFSGNRLTQTYPNAMDEVGQDIYACWLSDTEYAYVRCTEYGEPQTLFTVSVSQRPGKLPTDGAGVYALKTGEQTVTCFDRFGDTLGTIQAPFVVGDIDTDIMFENGCIRLTYRGSGLDDPAQTALYLPTGEQVE